MKGHTRKRGKGWSYVIDLDRVGGGRRQQWRSGFSTRAEAEKVMRKEIRERETGAFIEPSELSLGNYLNDWLAGVRADLRPTTVKSYEWAVNRHIVPRLGRTRLQDVSASHLNRLFGDLRESGLGTASVQYCYVVLRIALGAALDQELIAKNPALTARRPKDNGRREMRTWAPSELGAFLESVKDDRLYALYLLAGTTGMRRGEILGLAWRNVDLQNCWLTVQQSLVSVGYKLVLSQPKTKQSRRLVALDKTTISALLDHRLRMVAENALLGMPAPGGDDLVFTQPGGEPVHPHALAGYFSSRVKAAGLPYISLHGLRHTWATLALQANIHPKTVSERLGHSNISITLNTYSHAIPALQAEAADKVANLIFDEES
jgi:integrase